MLRKVQCFFSLKMPVNVNQYRGTIGVFNASVIMIEIKNRPISRLYYFCNTNQVSKNIYFFLVLFFYALLHYFRQKESKISLVCTGLIFCSLYCTILWLCKLKTSLSGDIESNPGPPQKNQNKLFSICHWNLNPLSANPARWSNTLKQFVNKLPTNCLTVFDHFVKLVLKGLIVLLLMVMPKYHC